MTRFLWSTYIVLWLLVAILTLLVLLLYRQYGRAMLPAKERMQLAGLDIGTSVRQLVIADANGAETRIPLSGASGNVVLRVILLAASHCPICASLWEQVGDLPSEQRAVEHWWIQSGEPKDDRAPEGWRIGLAGRAYFGALLGTGILTEMSTPLVWSGLIYSVAAGLPAAALYGMGFGFGRSAPALAAIPAHKRPVDYGAVAVSVLWVIRRPLRYVGIVAAAAGAFVALALAVQMLRSSH